jgi:PilZ domain
MGDEPSLQKGAVPSKGGPDGSERRRCPRYLFSMAMTVRTAAGMPLPGISVEISTVGMLVMVSGALRVGDTVELEPVAGGRTLAQVRHKLGRLYGFEFVELTSEQAVWIAESCQRFGRHRRYGKGA